MEIKNNFLNLNKSKWKPTKLGDLALEILKRVNNPSELMYDRFVGLDNFVSEDIVIKNWETTKNLKSAAKEFKTGDILFARRNAYLRRASLVNFNGCCSGDAFVLRVNHKKIVPGFLAFLVNSNQLWDYAITNAAGTMSKRVKWRDLSEYELLLPPKNEQEKLIKLLWSINKVIDSEKKIEDNFKIVLLAYLKKIFSKNNKREYLIDLCVDQPKYGANTPASAFDENVRFLRITDIGQFGELKDKKVSAKIHNDNYLLEKGDFLLARTADTGRSYFYKEEDGKCTYAGYLIRFKLDNSKILPEYLYYFTQTQEFKNWIRETTRTGTLGNINAKEFSKLKIPVIKIGDQRKTILETSKLYNILKDINKKINLSKSLQKNLINQIFNAI